jgi:hypothetical protein
MLPTGSVGALLAEDGPCASLETCDFLAAMKPVTFWSSLGFAWPVVAAITFFGFVLAAVVRVQSGLSVGDLLGFLVVPAVFGTGIYVRYLRHKRMVDRAEIEELIVTGCERTAKRKSKRVPERLAGKKCATCDNRIVVDFDGVRCRECGAPVHNECIKAHRGEAHTVPTGAYR